MQVAIVEDEVLLDVAARFPGWQVEFLDGQVVMSPPTGGVTGLRNLRLAAILQAYADDCGYVGFDSSTGFKLQSGDRPSPDGALVDAAAWHSLTQDEREGFVPLLPLAVVELVSKSDRARSAERLRAKCTNVWVAAGVPYVVLLHPYAVRAEERVTTWGVRPAAFPDLSKVVE